MSLIRISSWISVVIQLIAFILLLPSCKRDTPTTLSLCLSQYRKEVQLHIGIEQLSAGNDINVYRGIDSKTFQYIGSVKMDSAYQTIFLYRDTTVAVTEKYFYKVSFGNNISEANAIDLMPDFENFKLSPNPIKDTLLINRTYNCEPYNIVIADIGGQIKYREYNISEAAHTIDLSMLSSGAYLVQILYSGGNTNLKVLKS
jgi:hypothetical protein